jgi:MFS family permease
MGRDYNVGVACDSPSVHPRHRDAGRSCLRFLSPKLAFLLVAFSLGELGDGLNIFQGIYLVGIGWNEGSVGLALSLMGLTALLMQPVAGDWVDKTLVDRRVFLTVASILTAVSASTILLVREGNQDHALIFVTKVLEGLSASFIGPCLAALTLANFGPHHFDAIMASNILWGHVGSVLAAIVAGLVAYLMYPDIKYCFLVIGASALMAAIFVQYLPQGDALMGRGFLGKVALDEKGELEQLESDESTVAVGHKSQNQPPQPSAYLEVFLDMKTCILCLTGFFFQ